MFEKQPVLRTENGFVWCASSSAEIRYIRVFRAGLHALELNQVEVIGSTRTVPEGFVPPLSAFHSLLQSVSVNRYLVYNKEMNKINRESILNKT